MNVRTKFEVRSFTHFWDNRGYLYSKNLGSSCIYPSTLFSKIFNGLLFRWTLWMYRPNLKSIALPVPEITGVSQKILERGGREWYSPKERWWVPILPPSTLIRLWALVCPKFQTALLSRDANPKSWGTGGRRGSGMIPFKRALVSSCRPSIVSFPLSLCVSEIIPLLCSSMALFPTPPLVSQIFPTLPWEYVDGLWATKS